MSIALAPVERSDVESEFSDLLDAVLPLEGGLAVMLQAYFDESGTHEGSRVMCVSGYVFASSQAKKFTREWNKFLAANDIEYFRMSQCAGGHGPFKKFSTKQRESLVKQAVEIIVSRISAGFVCSISEEDYLSVVSKGWLKKYGSAYTILLQWCLASVGYWLDKGSYSGPVAYFFESGHRNQGEANKKKVSEQYRYCSHTFAGKRLAVPLQAADFLAWEWCKFWRETYLDKARYPRLSFARVILAKQTYHETKHLDRRILRRFILENLESEISEE